MDVTKESGEMRSGQSKKQKITKPTVAVNRNFSLHFENNDASWLFFVIIVW